jgi:hypothetical protein
MPLPRRRTWTLAERVVEPYWRLVSLSPLMAHHHLRSRNQGNNVLEVALVLGDSVSNKRLWFGSLFQTYSWIIAHDIGWAGTERRNSERLPALALRALV